MHPFAHKLVSNGATAAIVQEQSLLSFPFSCFVRIKTNFAFFIRSQPRLCWLANWVYVLAIAGGVL
jgi:hypothetical protein